MRVFESITFYTMLYTFLGLVAILLGVLRHLAQKKAPHNAVKITKMWATAVFGVVLMVYIMLPPVITISEEVPLLKLEALKSADFKYFLNEGLVAEARKTNSSYFVYTFKDSTVNYVTNDYASEIDLKLFKETNTPLTVGEWTGVTVEKDVFKSNLIILITSCFIPAAFLSYWVVKKAQETAESKLTPADRNLKTTPSTAGEKGSKLSSSRSGKDGKLLYEPVHPNVPLESIRGLTEVREEIDRIIDMIVNRDKYAKEGVERSLGVLLLGPPGTGKTLVAKAIATATQLPFFQVAGSEFANTFVGTGAANVRALFEEAKQYAKAIIFIDELDALSNRQTSNNDERKATINQMLIEISALEDCESEILIIGATNYAEALDTALSRSKRFDTHLTFTYPDLEERKEHITLKLNKIKHEETISIDLIAHLTAGRSFADIDTVLNNALADSIFHGKSELTKDYLSLAFYRLIMHGFPKKNWQRDSDSMRLVAYHEAGHALVSTVLLKEQVPFVTIVPSTSSAEGVAFSIPNEIKMPSKLHYIHTIMKMLAGRAAEEVLLSDADAVTAGASSDIDKATEVMKELITRLGMGEKGLVNLQRFNEQPSLLDEAVAEMSTLYKRTVDFLTDYKTQLDALADALYTQHTINGSHINRILGVDINNDNDLVLPLE